MSAILSRKTLLIVSIGFLAACSAEAQKTDFLSPGTSAPAGSLVVYYSFDNAPPADVFASMQAETARLFDPASIPVEWKRLSSGGGEASGEIVIARFHGECSTGRWSVLSRPLDVSGGFPLADSKTSNGQVLPFADIDCGALEQYLAGQHFADPSTAIGKAMARVLAHEVYHILTRSGAHAQTGIARAEHSRDNLTAASFAFGKSELDWLREWSTRSRMIANSGYSFGPDGDAGADGDVGSR